MEGKKVEGVLSDNLSPPVLDPLYHEVVGIMEPPNLHCDVINAVLMSLNIILQHLMPSQKIH